MNDYVGGWLKTDEEETKQHNRTLEHGARLIKNDNLAINFYELCEFIGISD